jgi:hypothetical protein
VGELSGVEVDADQDGVGLAGGDRGECATRTAAEIGDDLARTWRRDPGQHSVDRMRAGLTPVGRVENCHQPRGGSTGPGLASDFCASSCGVRAGYRVEAVLSHGSRS